MKISTSLKNSLFPTLLLGSTIGIFFLTRFPTTKQYLVQLTLLSVLILVGYSFFARTRRDTLSGSATFIYLVTVTILLLVAATGWFFSPFFFTLYLLCIALAFLLSLRVSFAFVVTLVLLFSVSIGELDVVYDILVILSLVTVVPLSVYLTRRYLELRQAEKKVLVLEQDLKAAHSVVQEALSNKVTKMAMELKEPINDIKQLSAYLKDKPQHTQAKEITKIYALSERAMTVLRAFQQEVTNVREMRTGQSLRSEKLSSETKMQ